MASLEQVVKFLRHQDENKRRQAIVWLAKSGDERALKPLAWSYKNDPNPELKTLAQKAGRKLKQTLHEDTTTAGGSLLAYSQAREEQKSQDAHDDSDYAFQFDEDDEDEYEAYDSYNLYDGGYSSYSGSDTYYDEDDEADTYRDDDTDDDDFFTFDDRDSYEDAVPKQVDYETKKVIKAAMDLLYEEEYGKALEKIVHVLKTDRAAQYDTQVLRMSATITGMNGEAAVAALMDPIERQNIMAEYAAEMKQKRKSKGGDDNDPTWTTAWADIGIFALVNIVGSTLLILLASGRFAPMIQQIAANPSEYSWVRENGWEDAFTLMADILGGAVLIMIALAVVSALYLVIVYLIQFMAIHFAAISVFNGEKPSAVTVDRLFNFQSVYTAITYVIFAAIILMLPNNAAAYSNSSADPAIALASLTMAGSALILSIISPIGMAWVTGRAQNFGFWNGCLSNIVGGIILGVLNCMFGLFMQMMLTFAAVAGGGG